MRDRAAWAGARTALLGCGALGLLAIALGHAGGGASAPSVSRLARGVEGALPVWSSRPGAVDEVVAATVVVIGAVVLAWYAASAAAFLACAVAACAGRRWRAGEKLLERWGAPLLRRAAGVALGIAVTTGMGATAAAGAAGPAPDLPDDLRWSPLQQTPAAPSDERIEDLDPASPAGGPAVGPGPTHVVRPGESLWSIAAAHLRAHGKEPTNPAVAAEWPRWYSANAETVGPDPDLIHPGQELLAPREGSHP